MFVAYKNYSGTFVMEMDDAGLRRKGADFPLGTVFIFGEVNGKKHVLRDHEIMCVTNERPNITPMRRDNTADFTPHSEADYYLKATVVGQDFCEREKHFVTKASCFGEAEAKVLHHIMHDTDGYSEYVSVYAGIDGNDKVFYEYSGHRDYGTHTNYEWKRKYIDDSYVRI